MRLSFRALPFALLTLAAACGTGGNGSAAWNHMPDPTTHETFFPSPRLEARARLRYPADHLRLVPRRRQQLPAVRLPLLPPARGQGRARPRATAASRDTNYFSRSCYMWPHPRAAGGAFPHRPVQRSQPERLGQRPDPSYVDTSIPSLSLQTAILPMPLDHASKKHRYDRSRELRELPRQRRRGSVLPGRFPLCSCNPQRVATDGLRRLPRQLGTDRLRRARPRRIRSGPLPPAR